MPGAYIQALNPGLTPSGNFPTANQFVAGGAVRAALSPDGKTLAVITAGHNGISTGTSQYLFFYDVSGANQAIPVLTQVINQKNSSVGLVWKDNLSLYTSGGSSDTVVWYSKTAGSFAVTKTIALGNSSWTSSGKNAAGLAISQDGTKLVVANNYNNSVSVIDTATNTKLYDVDLRPYANGGAAGAPGGEYPLFVVIKGNNTAYVGSNRDREIAVVNLGATSGSVTARIALDGNANGLAMNAAQTRLYAAQDNSDEVAIIDTAANAVVQEIDTRAPAGTIADPSTGGRFTGASPFGVTISPDGNTLYAVNDGSNSIAVIPLTGPNANKTVGLIPTGYAPKDLVFSADGTTMYVVNGKSDPGANYNYGTGATSILTQTTYPAGNAAQATAFTRANEYQFLLGVSSKLMAAPVPSVAQLASLTAQVAQNNFYSAAPLSAADQATMSFLHNHIHHVIYIVKENRTFDQLLGDLGNGSNGDQTLTVFGRAITPSFHRLASNFVTLDNFFDAADGSMDGWSLATRGRVTTTEELSQQINYGGHGLTYKSEGSNRNVPVGLDTAGRDAATRGAFTKATAGLPGGTANFLPGQNNVASTDAPFGFQQGFIYDAVLNAGGTVRNYGFLCNNIGASSNASGPISDPFGAGVVQVAPLDPYLTDKTDLYYRTYDNQYPDLWRFYEWNREFQARVAGGNLESLQTVRLNHDHMGNFNNAYVNLRTPEAQQADDDYAVGRIVQAVANSPYAKDTVIFVTEDDAQDGSDHVNSHRTTTYVVGPYVKQHKIISTAYNQVSVLRTIEDILGTQHINLNTAFQRPMVEVFDPTLNPNWHFTAVASNVLNASTGYILSSIDPDGTVQFAEGPQVVPTHDSAYWVDKTRGFDFSKEDRVPQDLFNKVIWEGIKGTEYPAQFMHH